MTIPLPALTELGVRNASAREALELAEKFHASVDGFILYRRIVDEMLKALDSSTATASAADVDVLDAVRTALTTNKVPLSRLRDLCEHYDVKGQDKVLDTDISRIFQEAGVRLSRPDIDGVCDRYAAKGHAGWIKYPQLLSDLERVVAHSAPSRRLPDTRLLTSMPDELSEKLRKLIEGLIISGKDYRAEMDIFDSTFTGALPQAEFRNCLQDRFRAGLTIRELEILERSYRDKSDTRRVNHVRLFHDLHPKHYGRQAFDSSEAEQVSVFDSSIVIALIPLNRHTNIPSISFHSSLFSLSSDTQFCSFVPSDLVMCRRATAKNSSSL